MFPDHLRNQLQDAGFVAVLVVEDSSAAVPLARALLAGGVRAIELTLRTPAAMDALRRIRAEVPDLIAGVGTVLSPQQVDEVKSAGAAFGVAPGKNPVVIQAAQDAGLPFAPGVCTPTEMELAVEQDCRLLKFFPAEPIGGRAYLTSMAAPLAHLGIGFLALGGVDASNMEGYLREPLVTAVGGSWVTPKQLIRRGDWDGITTLAAEASAIVSRVQDRELFPPEKGRVTGGNR